MSRRKSVFYYSPAIEQYPFPPDHPFNTSRAPKARELIRSMGWLSGPDQTECDAPPAETGRLQAFHTPRYLDELQRAAAGDLTPAGFAMGLGSPDTPVFTVGGAFQAFFDYLL